MAQSPSAIENWLDRDFFELGAFLTSASGESITFGKGGSVTLVDHFFETSTPVFYLKDFFKNTYLAYTPDKYLEVAKDDLETYLKNRPLDLSFSRALHNNDDLYEKDFSRLLESFNQDLQKVVLISRESYGKFEGEKTLKHLLFKALTFGTGLPYGFWHKAYGMIGSTPELLYNIEDGILSTFALAGTAKLGEETILLNSKKDLHEHNLVIQDISEKLAAFTENTFVHNTSTYPYKNMIHLKTNLEARVLPGINLTDLTNTFSPTAALGGYPKEKSLTFLQNSHYAAHYPDRYFGSAFGLITPTRQEFVVSIRNVQWDANNLFIESGGGVVQESELQKELAEIHLKRNTIRKHYL